MAAILIYRKDKQTKRNRRNIELRSYTLFINNNNIDILYRYAHT